MNKQNNIAVEDLAEPLTYPVEAFISPEFAKAERELLWPKVWQMAGPVEDIPDVGNFFTYNILDESIIVVRTAPDHGTAFDIAGKLVADEGAMLEAIILADELSQRRHAPAVPARKHKSAK